jgi:hypothetical protein
MYQQHENTMDHVDVLALYAGLSSYYEGTVLLDTREIYNNKRRLSICTDDQTEYDNEWENPAGSVANDRRNCDYLHCLSMPKGPLLPQLWNL